MAEVPRARLTLLGTRGSIAVGGAGTARHGGATACVVVDAPDGRLILDAGTGLRSIDRLAPSPVNPADHHHLLLSHLHWDHLAGLPFFPPLYRDGASLDIWAPDQPSATAATVLDRLLDPAVWPLPRRARIATHSAREGSFEVGGFAVSACRLAHPGVTMGYRVTLPRGGSVSYITDNELGMMHLSAREALVHLIEGSDVLIHDATWSHDRAAARAGWGHSSAEEAVGLGRAAGVGSVVLFHHDPDADDQAIDAAARAAGRDVGPGGPAVVAGADGMVLEF